MDKNVIESFNDDLLISIMYDLHSAWKKIQNNSLVIDRLEDETISMFDKVCIEFCREYSLRGLNKLEKND